MITIHANTKLTMICHM